MNKGEHRNTLPIAAVKLYFFINHFSAPLRVLNSLLFEKVIAVNVPSSFANTPVEADSLFPRFNVFILILSMFADSLDTIIVLFGAMSTAYFN